VSPLTRIKEPSSSIKDPEVFQAVIRLVRNNVTTHDHILKGCLTITVIYQTRIFAFLIIVVTNAMPGEGLVWFLIPAPLWLPPIGNGDSRYQPRRLLTKWNWPGYQPGTSINWGLTIGCIKFLCSKTAHHHYKLGVLIILVLGLN
jgi:hypothetical protein